MEAPLWGNDSLKATLPWSLFFSSLPALWLGLEACCWNTPRRASLLLSVRQWKPGAVWKERRERTRSEEQWNGRGRRRRETISREQSQRREEQAQTWVYPLTVCIWPPQSRIATLKCGTGISAARHVQSTGQLILCRNEDGRPDVVLTQLLMLHNSKYLVVCSFCSNVHCYVT